MRAAKALSLRGQNENDLMREAHRAAARHLYEERNAQVPANKTNNEEVYIDLHGLHPAEAVSYLASALADRRSDARLQRDEGEGSKRGVLYAIVGTGSHSRNGRDKVGKAIRAYLNECRYAFREFGVPGEGGAGGKVGIASGGGAAVAAAAGSGGGAVGGSGGQGGGGGVLGIDALSGDLSTVKNAEAVAVAAAEGTEGKKSPDGGGGEEGVEEENANGGGLEGVVKAAPAPVMQVGKIRILKADEARKGVV